MHGHDSVRLDSPQEFDENDPVANEGNGDYDAEIDNACTLSENASKTEERMEKKAVRPKILPPEPDNSEKQLGNEEATTRRINFQTKSRKLRNQPYNINARLSHGRCLIRVGEDPPMIRDSPCHLPSHLEKNKCRDYEELGYCLLGDNCPLSHGSNSIVVHGSFNSNPNGLMLSQIPQQTSLPHLRPARPRSCSLLVRKIPNDCNNIFKINEYFSQFGEVKHIQVAFGAPDTALVTYESTTSATNAFRSKKPIFDNRFVSLKWHTPDEATQSDTALFNNYLPTEQQQQQQQVSHRSNRSSFTKTYGNPIRAGLNSNDAITTNDLREQQAHSLTVQKKDEKLLSLKTDLCLKLSEQARLVLLKVQSSTSEKEKVAYMKQVDEVQKNLTEARRTLMELHAKIQKRKATTSKHNIASSSGSTLNSRMNTNLRKEILNPGEAVPAK